MRTSRVVLVATTLLATTVVAGCGGSGGPAAAGGGAASRPGGGSSAAAAASSAPGVAGALQGAEDTAGKVCAAITSVDVQAVLKAPTAVTVNPLECAWNGGGLTVQIYPNDASGTYYGDQAGTAGSNHPMAGVGDKAVWLEAVPGATIPEVVSQKGSTTCVVQLSASPPDTTLAYTGHDPFYTITTSHAQDFATKVGRLCTDAFSAAG